MIEGDASIFRSNQVEVADLATDENPTGCWLGRYKYGAVTSTKGIISLHSLKLALQRRWRAKGL